MHGTVVDPAGGGIQAGVYLHNAKQLVGRTSATKTGDFDVDVPPGDYLLEVRDAISFSPAMRRVTVAEVPNDVGRIEVEISGCEYPGTNCDYFGKSIPKAPAINVEEVCGSLRAPKDRWVVLVGRLSADGMSFEGNCGELPVLGTLRLPARIALDPPIGKESFLRLPVRNVEKKIEKARSMIRGRNEGGTFVAAYGYLSLTTGLKASKCKVACSPDFDVAPAHLIVIQAYRELP